MGASIYDVRKIFEFFETPLSMSQISRFFSFRLLFGDPLPPPTADVIYGSPLSALVDHPKTICETPPPCMMKAGH